MPMQGRRERAFPRLVRKDTGINAGEIGLRGTRMRALFGMAAFAVLAAMVQPAHAAVAPGLVVQEPQLSSAAAQKLVEACVAIAEKTNAPMAVAVVDPAGNLLHFHALQGASPTAPITAQLKAVTAAR